MRDHDLFVWTEAIGCGEILSPCIASYLAHHDIPIHVFGYKEDLIELVHHHLIKPVTIDSESFVTRQLIESAYKRGHSGTSLLWSSIIYNRDENFLVHLDADTVFLADVVTPLVEKLREGYSIVGTRRPYKNQVKRGIIKGVRAIQFLFYRDAVNTHCFAFNRRLVKVDKENLAERISGSRSSKFMSRLFPVIDFFDSVTFRLSKSGKGIYYMDSNSQARSGEHHLTGKIESSMISFAAVGSGSNFIKNPETDTSVTYKEFAIASYALYSEYLLGRKIGHEPLKSEYLKDKLSRLDKNTWTLDQEK